MQRCQRSDSLVRAQIREAAKLLPCLAVITTVERLQSRMQAEGRLTTFLKRRPSLEQLSARKPAALGTSRSVDALPPVTRCGTGTPPGPGDAKPPQHAARLDRGAQHGEAAES